MSTARIKDLESSKWFQLEQVYDILPPNTDDKNETLYPVIVLVGLFKHKKRQINVSPQHYQCAKEYFRVGMLFAVTKSSPIPASNG